MSAPVVTFLSDYGLADEFVGVCHGVIARRCPRARIIDIAHGIALGDVLGGALALGAALPHMPAGVHLAVVDPGVGGPRRAVAVAAAREGHVIVAPDNGLAAAAAQALGGAAAAWEISGSAEARPSGAATFAGRDLFAPVAAAIADGVAPAKLGEALAVAELVALETPAARRDGELLLVPVLAVDGFGNIELAAFALAGAALTIELDGRTREIAIGRRFGDVPPGELVAYVDSRGAPAIARNGGSAAALLGLRAGAVLRVRA